MANEIGPTSDSTEPLADNPHWVPLNWSVGFLAALWSLGL